MIEPTYVNGPTFLREAKHCLWPTKGKTARKDTTAQAGRQFEAYQSDLPTPDVKGEEISEKDVCIILQLG
jgi:hypothetical protein